MTSSDHLAVGSYGDHSWFWSPGPVGEQPWTGQPGLWVEGSVPALLGSSLLGVWRIDILGIGPPLVDWGDVESPNGITE